MNFSVFSVTLSTTTTKKKLGKNYIVKIEK